MYSRITHHSRHLLVALAAVALTACNSAQASLNDLRRLNADLRDNRARFTSNDWKACQQRLDNIRQRIDRYNYSDEQLKEIGSLTTSCYVLMGKNTVGTVLDDVHRTVKQAQGAADEIKAIIDDVKHKR